MSRSDVHVMQASYGYRPSPWLERSDPDLPVSARGGLAKDGKESHGGKQRVHCCDLCFAHKHVT